MRMLTRRGLQADLGSSQGTGALISAPPYYKWAVQAEGAQNLSTPFPIRTAAAATLFLLPPTHSFSFACGAQERS